MKVCIFTMNDQGKNILSILKKKKKKSRNTFQLYCGSYLN